MAIKTKCQTPGAKFHTEISPDKIGISVELPFLLHLTSKEAEELEANLHNAMEMVVALATAKRVIPVYNLPRNYKLE